MARTVATRAGVVLAACAWLAVGGAAAAEVQARAADPAALAGHEEPGEQVRDTELARLDGFARGMAAAERFSGVVLIADGDRVVFERAYGPVDPGDAGDSPAAITPATRFNLASAGKMFTATAILQQVAAGRVTLDTPVGAVIRDYPKRAVAERVTIRHLLTHRSGMGDIDLFGTENAANRAAARTTAQQLALHWQRAPAFPPGTRQEYGNFAFVILARMVELLSGSGYEAYLDRHVFGPAGMKDTGFVDCADPAPDIAVGLAGVDGGTVRNCATVPGRGFGAGGQVSTARDMLRLVRALQDGRLIPRALFAEATRTHAQFMGLGFFATGYGEGVPPDHFRWGHGGGADGINTDIRHYPAIGRTVIVLANRDAPAAHQVANFEMEHRAGD